MPTPIKVPGSLAELLANPDRVRDAFTLLNGLATLQIQLTVPDANSAASQGKASLRGEGPDNIIMPLALKFSSPVNNDVSATAVSVSAKLNELLGQLRRIGINPGNG